MCRNVQMFLKFITENSRQRKRFFEVYLPPTSVIALRSHHRPEEGDEPAHEAVDEKAQFVLQDWFRSVCLVDSYVRTQYFAHQVSIATNSLQGHYA